MKELILRSKKYPHLIVQIFNGNEFGMLTSDDERVSTDDEFFTDNDEYAYEILKLLREAEKRGCFNQSKIEDGAEETEKAEEILI